MGDTLKINNNGSLLESDGTRGWHIVILDASSDVVGAGVTRYPKYLHVFNHCLYIAGDDSGSYQD